MTVEETDRVLRLSLGFLPLDAVLSVVLPVTRTILVFLSCLLCCAFLA